MFEKLIYLDNAASTRMDERVLEVMTPYFLDKYAVATSEFGYSAGIEAREALDDARSRIASSIRASSEEIVFTSGSAESSNLALKGVAKSAKKGKNIIVSKIEDFPVLHSARSLEKDGFKVSYLNVDREGSVDTNELARTIGDDTILVSIQHANQEVGTLQDIGAIARICQEKNVLFHTDATHTFTRVPLDMNTIPADLVTLSAHTIHGPKGIGALFIRKGTPLTKLMDGGFQEFNMRGGLENIPSAVGFAKAAELVTQEENDKIRRMRDRLTDRLLSEIPDTMLNGPKLKRTPQNANVTFHYVEGESLTLHLDMRGIAVSTGSACFSKSLEASHVILGIGGDHERAHGSVRFTFGRYNRMEDIDYVVASISEIVEELRKISPLGKGGYT
jgi:cysteine desulfurase